MEGFKIFADVPVRFADTDALGHVNNANYLSFLESSRLEYIKTVLGRVKAEDFGVIIARIEIDYKSPAFHYETLRVGCRVSEIGGSSIMMDYRIEDKATGRLVALAKSVMVAFDYALGRPVRVNPEWREKMEEFDGIS
ncbi:MAG: acyl-CoA thioesterase [Elusimicrobia bacterium]|nr:acyl-CoA thioesterase [Elusimicrobiota bacterium]MDE2511198.1 acyl-CoA thioesterase [Elusimicrobiota bacterium]